MSPLLPAQRPTPSQLRHIPGSTSPSQPPRARIGWWDQGSRGPHHTGRVWRTEITSPWAITSTTTACRYGSLRYFSDTVFLGVTTLWDPKRLVKFYYSSMCFSKSHFGDTEMFEAISLLTSRSSSPSPSFSGCELLSSSSSQFWASFVPSLMSHRGYICICKGLKSVTGLKNIFKH